MVMREDGPTGGKVFRLTLEMYGDLGRNENVVLYRGYQCRI